MTNEAIRIFVSHSHSDQNLARALLDYLLATLAVDAEDIICTSIPGFDLPFGQTISERLRSDVDGSLGFIALLTEDSLDSTWVKFELGAAWVKQKQVIPILGPGLGVKDERLGPLSALRCIAIDDSGAPSAIAGAIRQVANLLNVENRAGARSQDLLERFIKAYRENGGSNAIFGGTKCDLTVPGPAERVGRTIGVRLKLEGVPANGSVWLAIEDSNLGLLWPKGSGPLPRRDGEHAVHIEEGGNPAPGALGIVVLGVGHSGDSRIRRWMKEGNDSGHFPGLRLDAIPGAVLIEAVRGLTLEEGRATQPQEAREKRKVRFVCNSPQATSAGDVYVAGTFNDWLGAHDGKIQPHERFRLQKTTNNGAIVWENELSIPIGPHEFKFVVGDNFWINWYRQSGYPKGSDAAGGSNFHIVVS